MKNALAAIVISVAVAGCSTGPMKAPASYPQLNIKADEANTLLFTKPDLKLGQYSKVYIAPVKVQISNDQGVKDVSDAETATLAAYTERRLKEELGKHATLVNGLAPDVLSVRFMITDLEPTSKAQLVMMVPPFALVNMLSPKGAFLGSITLAGELHEGLESDASVAFVATRSRPGADASVAFSRWAVAERIIDNAAERLASDLAKARETGH